MAIDEALVRRLLGEQQPDLAGLPLELCDAGWDNVMWRLGTRLAVRMPRRQVAAPLIETEQRWLPELAPVLPLPVPVPLRKGRPSAGYPWPWSVVPWIEGVPGDRAPTADPAVDIGAAWMSLVGRATDRFWASYGRCEPGLERRARGLTVLFALMLLEIGLDGRPAYAEIGRSSLDWIAGSS